MSRTLKALIIGGIFCVLGLVTFFIGYHFNGYRLDNIFAYEAPVEDPLVKKSYELTDPDDLVLISISTKRMPITIKAHDEDQIIIEYLENQDQLFEITDNNGKLFFKKQDTGFFEEYISSNIMAYLKKEEPEGIVLYIPKTYDGELYASTSFGDISIPDALSFSLIKKIDFKNSFADVNINSLSGNILNLKVARGNINCSDIKFKSITFICTSCNVQADYISSEKLDIITKKGIIDASNIMSDNIDVDADGADIHLRLLAYSNQYNIKINEDHKSILNFEQTSDYQTDKEIVIKTNGSMINITFTLDK